MDPFVVANCTAPSHPCIIRLIEKHANETPNAIAFLAPGRPSLTYAGLYRHIEMMVQELNRMGIGRQDRVAVVLANGPELATSFLAISAAATFAPLNPIYRESEFNFYLEDLSARALVVERGVDSSARLAAAKLGIPIIELVRELHHEAGTFSLIGDAGPAPAACGYARANDCALVLHTSGTTARPKRVPLSQANVCASAHNIAATLKLTPRDRCLNVMPLFHIHGLLGAVLSSVTAGASVVCPPGYLAEQFAPWLAEFLPTWYTAVPTIHRSIVAQAGQSGQDCTRAGLRFIRSSSSPLAPQLFAELEQTFGVPVLEAYGMTEASHQMCSNPLPPRLRKPGSVGLAAGPEVAIMDEAGHLLGPDAPGEIVIRGPNVTAGYEGQASANGSAFTDGWFRTGDQGHRDKEGYFYVTGRIKEMINRGGEKIIPREVDEALLSHPAVSQAVTFAVPHARLGEDIAAAVVLRPGGQVSSLGLRKFTLERLAPHKVPTQVIFVPEIPKGPTGKVQRIGLHKSLDHQLKPDFVEPVGAVEKGLARIWCELLGLERVGVHENFFYLGGDSLLAARLFAQIETTFGKGLPLVTLFKATTITELALVLKETVVQSMKAQVVEIQPKGQRPPLFFLPSLVGDIWYPRGIAGHLSPDQPVFGILPSREEGQAFASIETLAARYVDVLRGFDAQGPYHLAGYSFAGLVAYEMARQLTDSGSSVATLALIDTHPRPLGKQSAGALALLRNSLFWLLDDLLHTSPKEMVARLRRHVRAARKGGRSFFSPIPTGQVELESLFPVEHLPASYRELMEANLRASREFVCKPYSGRVTLLRARTRPLFRPLHADLGWSRLAQGGVDLRVIPGDHGSILKEPYVRVLAQHLQAALDGIKLPFSPEQAPRARRTRGTAGANGLQIESVASVGH